MDTMMKWTPDAEEMTIRCRNKTNWIRIIVLTLAYGLAGWTVFAGGCSVIDGSISFRQALVTPLALIFLVFDLASTFVSLRQKYASR